MEEYFLAERLSDVDQYLTNFDNPDKVMGNDLEASRLNTRLARLAGISLSLKPGSAIYVPTGHNLGTNLPKGEVIEKIKKKEEEGYRSLFWFAQYDLNVYQVNTGWAPRFFTDVLELVYLEDPDRKQKGLKLIAKEELGRDPDKFTSLFTPEELEQPIQDISTKSPQRCRDYACADSDNTISIRYLPKFKEIETEFAMAVKVDTKLVDIVRIMEHNGGMKLNRQYIDEKITYLTKLAEVLKDMVYRVCGFTFDINSPKQLGIALFDRLGYPSPGLTRGKHPIHKTGAEDLEKLSATYPVVEYILSYRKVTKARSTYFEKLKTLDDMKIPVRFRFQIYSAPTFRFAAPGGDPIVDGHTGVNIQAVSNGELRDILAVDLGNTETKDSYVQSLQEDELLVKNLDREATEEEIVRAAMLDDRLSKEKEGYDGTFQTLPWVLSRTGKGNQKEDVDLPVCIRETCKGCPHNCEAKGMDVTRRILKNVRMIPSVRQAFMAPEGYTMVSFDYDRQELVIGANMSGEPTWIEALKRGEDLHEKTAAGAYGMDVKTFLTLPKDEYKEKRAIGKIMNFAVFYGATEYTLARKANIAQSAATEIYNGFVRDHPILFGWIHKVHLFARKNGYTNTFFGRRRWLKQFYDTNDKRMIAFANRSAVNTAIQGTGAEVTRIAMVKVDAMLRQNGIPRKDCYFVMQLHDELSFMIRDELVTQISPLIREKMAFNVKSWPVQLTVDGKLGKIWGMQSPIKKYFEERSLAWN